MEESRYVTTIAVGIVMATLASIAVALRFRARRVRKVSFKADDYAVVIALICLLGQCICNLVGAIVGRMGTHYSLSHMDPSDTVALQKMILRSKVIWSLNVLCSLGPGFVRTSVILFYQRIFIETPFLMVSWTIFALNATWTLGFFLSNLLSCVPISGNWAVGLPPSSCVDFLMLFKSMVVSSVILDGVVLMLPWYPLWKLNMPTMRKVVVSGILLLGGLAVLFSIFRAVAMFDALVPNPDTTWTRAPAFYWATLETGMGTISACLPTLRPLMSKPGPESMVRSLHRKLRRTLSRTKLSQDSNSMEHFPRESGESGEKSFRTMEAQGPLVYDGPRSTAYDRATRIEAGQNEDLPTSSEAIVVKSTFQSY